ncbi:hypothetical protein JCM10207_002941 [Rhodosporidiobolus poonsookiae]
MPRDGSLGPQAAVNGTPGPSSLAGRESDNEDFPSSDLRTTSTSAPLTNRGNKLSRTAPHVRRGKLGHHAHVDAGFSDPLMSRAALVPPAQKRRKLNDLAPSHARDGFPVAPNLHLVPRPIHALSREGDEPYAAYLPPAAQSPLDLLLAPAIQHTLGKKNGTFHALGMSTTGLIEQEAELVAALTGVCRGLRGEGFEWRWDGDEARKRAQEEQAAADEAERLRKADERDRERAARREAQMKRREEADARHAAEAEVEAEEQERQAMGVDRQLEAQGAAQETPLPAPEGDSVKLEQETPVLQPPAAPAVPAEPVAVPGISTATPAATETPAPSEAQAEAPAAAAASAEPAQAPAAGGDVEMTDAQPAAPTADASAPTGEAQPAPTHPAAPSAADTPAADVPAIAITDDSASAAPAVNGEPTPTPAPAADGASPALPAGENGTPAATPSAPGANGDALAVPSTEPTPAPAGGDESLDAAGAGTGAGTGTGTASAEATPFPPGEGDDEPTRRRSGRVATRGTGAVPLRHTRSRQSSPEEEYTSGGEDEFDAAYGAGGAGSDEGEDACGAGGARRGVPVQEEPLPEYAQRLVDPEVFVRGLFVTEGGAEGEGAGGGTVEMERMAQGPHGGLVGTGQMETLTANEQEVLLHDCLTDLHRFLADTLEYRARLGEIRDGVLGVERRRKGMWKVLRTVAMDCQPSHLRPYLAPTSPLSTTEKRTLFTSVYLRAASSGNADTLEWLLSLPPNPSLSLAENAAAARRFSLTAASLNNGGSHGGGGGYGGVGLGLGGSSGAGPGAHSTELPDDAPRKWVDLEATDEEGNTALGLCAALGHAEAVRVLVESGVRINQGDRLGWTPLHWAVQNNDIPIAAYLLNHRASPLIASHKGLSPRDLVKDSKDGGAMRDVLQSAWEAAVERERALRRAESEMNGDGGSGSGKGKERDDGGGSGGGTFEGGGASGRPSSRLSMASLAGPGGGAGGGGGGLFEQRDRAEQEAREKELRRKMQLGMDSAHNLEMDMGVLGLGEGRSLHDDDEPDEDEGIRHPFVWDRCLADQMLVFGLPDLPTLFDVVITTIKPVRARKFRVIPANVLFLCTRFAHYFGNEELLEELLIGAMERIEAAVHMRPDDMANCAFWLSNTLLLLYYLRKEPNVSRATHTYQVHLCDLVNEIFVFVIRDAERRIDRVLEAALLEHEALPGFEDVAFEDEWASTRLVKKLTGRGKKSGMRPSTSARSLFSAAGGAGDLGVSVGAGGGGVGGGGGSDSPPPRQRHVSASQIPVADATPRSITALLSSTLFVLQIYEIPPSIVVQAFSQLFYWIACEVFNRLLTQRKYLCRSRAMQIRLNASNLEDWARANRLPTKMVSVHFTPLNQLLQWLQCLSSESSIDGLIGTVQSLHALNPLQLRKAVRDYRYEVDESRMDDDCAQYLVQIQKQWERLRMQRKVDGVHGEGGASGAAGEAAAEGAGRATPPAASAMAGGDADADDASATSAQEDVVRMIDDTFADPSSFGSYAPPGGAEALGELLNSRYMLPFAVPTSAEMLVNFDAPDAFGPFANARLVPPRANSEGTATPRSSSRLSLSSTSRQSTPASTFSGGAPLDDAASIKSFATDTSSARPAGALGEKEPFVPVLPDDFFAVWDAARVKAGQRLGTSASAQLLAGVTSWESSPAVPWTEWRREAGAALEDGEVGDGEGSVVDHGESREGLGIDSSFEEDEGGVEETPRPRAGFQP